MYKILETQGHLSNFENVRVLSCIFKSQGFEYKFWDTWANERNWQQNTLEGYGNMEEMNIYTTQEGDLESGIQLIWASGTSWTIFRLRELRLIKLSVKEKEFGT
jgi:hypothetical protein